MTVTFRTPTVAASATGTEPTGASAGDLMIGIAEGTSAPSLPADWQSVGTYTDANTRQWLVATITRGASAPGYTFTNASTVFVYAAVAFSGTVSMQGNTDTSNGGGSYTIPANGFQSSDGLIIVMRNASSGGASMSIANLANGAASGFGSLRDFYGLISAAGNGPYTPTNWNALTTTCASVQVGLTPLLRSLPPQQLRRPLYIWKRR